MKFTDILSQIKNLLSTFSGVEWSFGKPLTIGDCTIIPVAKTSMALGGGGGSAPVSVSKKAKKDDKEAETPEPAPEATPASAGEGGGGGGGVKTEPVGIYLIKGDKVRFYPVISLKELIAAFGIFSLLIYRIMRLRRKK